MAKERGNIEMCLAKTLHHVAPHKARLFADGDGRVDLKTVDYRFRLVNANLTEVEKKILEIREAAKKGDCAAVLKALDDDIEFGHDL